MHSGYTQFNSPCSLILGRLNYNWNGKKMSQTPDGDSIYKGPEAPQTNGVFTLSSELPLPALTVWSSWLLLSCIAKSPFALRGTHIGKETVQPVLVGAHWSQMQKGANDCLCAETQKVQLRAWSPRQCPVHSRVRRLKDLRSVCTGKGPRAALRA